MKKSLKDRKFKRRHLIFYLRVFDAASGDLVGSLVDITPEGVMLVNDKPLPLDTHYHLRMVLPADVFGKHELSFEAKTMWCRNDINPDFFDIGFEFVNIEHGDAMTIVDLVDQYGFHD
ncbi:MAG: PilZ domain-containing protein [Sulfuricellaceae bacterium]|nr:PilZ domain-containing protein [Sulfuricellaceae bacterium]